MGRYHWQLVAAAIVSAGLCAAAAASAPAAAVAGHVATGAVEEAGWVPIGGIRQWVTISGNARNNPVILFLHGGPGNPLSPYSDSIYGAWTKDFTIVQWDQRGAGRTFEENPGTANEELTIDRMANDGIEVAEYLTRHLGAAKVLLVGGSWGSALGVHMIARRPDLFQAYVGVGQLVSEHANQAASLERVRLLAAAAKDEATLEAIGALGPPPWTDPRSFGKLRRLTRVYEAKLTDPAPKSWWVPAAAYTSPAYEKAYEAAEEYSYLQFVGLKGGGLISTIDLSKLGTKFEVPIYLVQGAEDLVTAPDVSRAWFDTIEAPEKRYLVVPRAGHDPNQGLIDATYAIVREVQAARPR